MIQEGIRARSYLGFPQTGMKEGFVIARPLVGVASLHVRHTVWRGKNGGGVVVTLLQLLLKWMEKDDTCNIVTQLCQLSDTRFVRLLVFLSVYCDCDLQLRGLMTRVDIVSAEIVLRSEVAFIP